MDCPGRGVQVPGDQEITPPFRACPCPRVASWGRTPGPFQADQAQCPESVTGDFPRLLSVFLIEGRAVPRASAVVCFFNRNFCFSLMHGPKVPGPFPLANLCPRCFPSPERLVSSCLSEQVPSGWRGAPQPAGPLPEGLRDPAQSGPLPTAPPGGQLAYWGFASATSGEFARRPPQTPELGPEGDARCRVSQSLLRARPSQPGWAHEPRLPRSPEDRTAKRPGCLFRSLFTKFQVRSYARGLGRPQRSCPRE